MARGYVHHAQPYKSPAPGPTPAFTDAQRETLTPQQAKQVRRSVHDLARAITDRAGLAPRPVYVQSADPLTPFYTMIDNDLRDVLVHIGYTLADRPGAAYVFRYEARHLDQPQIMKESSAVHEAKNVSITLKIFDGVGRDAKMLTYETGHFHIDGVEEMPIPGARFIPMQKAEKR